MKLQVNIIIFYELCRFGKTLLESNTYLIGPGSYPKDTEFLHTVRYIDIDKTNDTIKMASRMKELRYGKKYTWLGDWEMEKCHFCRSKR